MAAVLNTDGMDELIPLEPQAPRRESRVEPAAPAPVKPRRKWQEVQADPRFQALSSEDQEAARAQYFDEVVAPQVDETELPLARKQFDQDTRPGKVRQVAHDAGRVVGGAAMAAKGILDRAADAAGPTIDAGLQAIQPPPVRRLSPETTPGLARSKDTITNRIISEGVNQGLSPIAAAGMAGNFDHETGGFRYMQEIKPTVPGSRGGYGWAQWTGPRRDEFLRFAKDNNLSPSSPEANLGYAFKELREGKHVPPDLLKRMNAAKTPEEAARLFRAEFERPGVVADDSRAKRAVEALSIWQSQQGRPESKAAWTPEQARTLPQELYGLPLQKGYIDTVRAKWDAAGPAERARMLTSDSEAEARVARFLRDGYAQADRFNDPALSLLDGRREKREEAYRFSGADPESARRWADTDLKLGIDRRKDEALSRSMRPGYFDMLADEFKRGLINLGANAGDQAAFALDVAGADQAAKGLLESMKLMKAEAEALAGPVQDFAQINTDQPKYLLDDATRYVGSMILSNLPMMLPSIGTGVLGGVVAQKAAQTAAKALVESVGPEAAAKYVMAKVAQGAAIGAGASAVGLETGSIYGDIYGETGQMRPGVAVAGGIPAAALDAIPAWRAAIKLLGPAAAHQVAGTVLKRLGREAGIQLLAESGTEFAQTLIERGAVHVVDGQPLVNEADVHEAINAAIAGGLTGGAMGGLSQGAAELRRPPSKAGALASELQAAIDKAKLPMADANTGETITDGQAATRRMDPFSQGQPWEAPKTSGRESWASQAQRMAAGGVKSAAERDRPAATRIAFGDQPMDGQAAGAAWPRPMDARVAGAEWPEPKRAEQNREVNDGGNQDESAGADVPGTVARAPAVEGSGTGAGGGAGQARRGVVSGGTGRDVESGPDTAGQDAGVVESGGALGSGSAEYQLKANWEGLVNLDSNAKVVAARVKQGQAARQELARRGYKLREWEGGSPKSYHFITDVGPYAVHASHPSNIGRAVQVWVTDTRLPDDQGISIKSQYLEGSHGLAALLLGIEHAENRLKQDDGKKASEKALPDPVAPKEKAPGAKPDAGSRDDAETDFGITEKEKAGQTDNQGRDLAAVDRRLKMESALAESGRQKSGETFKATVEQTPLPDWTEVNGVKVLRSGDSRYVAVPANGRESAARYDVIDTISRGLMAQLRKDEVRKWLWDAAKAEHDADGDKPSAVEPIESTGVAANIESEPDNRGKSAKSEGKEDEKPTLKAFSKAEVRTGDLIEAPKYVIEIVRFPSLQVNPDGLASVDFRIVKKKDKDGRWVDQAGRNRNETVGAFVRLFGVYPTADAVPGKPVEVQAQGVSPAKEETRTPVHRAAGFGANNTLFTKEDADAAREILRKKLNQLNAGLDPEMLAAGMRLAGYYVEGGARRWADYVQAMVDDLGEAVRPYLRSFYEGVRHYPGLDKAGLESSAALDQAEALDVWPGDVWRPKNRDAQFAHLAFTVSHLDAAGNVYQAGDYAKIDRAGVADLKRDFERVRQAGGAEAATTEESPAPSPYEKDWAEIAQRMGGKVVFRQGDIALILGYSLFGNPVFAGVKGSTYTRADIASYTGDLFTQAETAALTRAKDQWVRADAAAHEANPDGPFAGGLEVAFSDSVPDAVRGVIAAWRKQLGIPARIFVAVNGDARGLDLHGPFAAVPSQAIEPNEPGSKRRLSNGDFSIVYNPQARLSETLEVLAHELGHVLMDTVYRDSPDAIKLAIRQEFDAWLKGSKGRPAGEHVRSMRPRGTGRRTAASVQGGQMADDLTPYWRSFNEWFADQVSRWATTQEKPLTAVQQFFKRLGQKLKAFFARNRQYWPTVTMREWLDGLSPTVVDQATAEASAPPNDVVDGNKMVDSPIAPRPSPQEDEGETKAATTEESSAVEENAKPIDRLDEPPHLNYWVRINNVINAADIMPPVGKRWSDDEQDALKNWLKAAGFTVFRDGGHLHAIGDGARQIPDGAKLRKVAKENAATAARADKEAAAKSAREDEYANSPAAAWIESNMGGDFANPYNKLMLARFLDGKDDFKGLASRLWIDPLKRLGFDLNPNDRLDGALTFLKTTYQNSKSQQTEETTPEALDNPPPVDDTQGAEKPKKRRVSKQKQTEAQDVDREASRADGGAGVEGAGAGVVAVVDGPGDTGGVSGGEGGGDRVSTVRTGSPGVVENSGVVDGDAGAAKGGDGHVSTRVGTSRANVPDVPRGDDYRIPVGGLTREGSWLDTARRNVEIVELVNRLTQEGRPATADEQALLVKFTGWGAADIRNQLFHPRAGTFHRYNPAVLSGSWRELGERVAAVFTKEDWKTVLRSTQYAHYTSEAVVRAAWQGVERLGFAGGVILEPGAGIGHFAGLMPDGIYRESKYLGIEMDGFTAKIAQLLYPGQTIRHADYVRSKVPKMFDLAIGNPPFASTAILDDPEYARQKFPLHDYFFAKSLDRVRPGGLLVFVTSRFSLDKKGDRARRYLAERADLLGAIRLPNTAFKANAGTQVVTDILFLRRREPGQAPAGESWLGLETMNSIEGEAVPVNEYFARHPEMILGQVTTRGDTLNPGEAFTVNPAGELEPALSEAIQRLPANVYSVAGPDVAAGTTQRTMIEKDWNPKYRKEGGLYLSDAGELMRVESGAGAPLSSLMRLTAKEQAWLTDYVGVRDALKQAQYDQLSDGDWEASFKALKKAYAAFVKQHGPMLSFTQTETVKLNADGEEETQIRRRFKNDRLLLADIDGRGLMTALEVIREDGSIAPGAVLQGRVLKRPAEPKIESVDDALAVSLAQTGRFDLAHVARLAGLEVNAALERLGDLVFETPEGGHVLAEEYLSGDVRTKLDEAEAAAALHPRFARNVEALTKVQPPALASADVTVGMGATWVPLEFYQQYAQEVVGLDKPSLKYNPVSNEFEVSSTDRPKLSRRESEEWGTAYRSPVEVFDAAMNHRTVKVYVGSGTTNDPKRLDPEETKKVELLVRRMEENFSSWVWTDSQRTARVLDIYNDKFNRLAPRFFNGDHLNPPGLSLRYDLHKHQKRAIWRAIVTGNTYFAHAVGAGKTLEMIIAGMEQKRLGLINKPMYVVPNHMLEQFASEFMDAYPAANIMVADEKNFAADNRRRFIAQAALNNPDAIIITHSAFTILEMKPENMQAAFDDVIDDLRATLEELPDDFENRKTRGKIEAQLEKIERAMSGSSTERFTQRKKLQDLQRALEEMRKKLVDYQALPGVTKAKLAEAKETIAKQEALIQAQAAKARTEELNAERDRSVLFEDMGVDFLFVDECFSYHTLVETDQGFLPIGRIVEEQLPVHVLSVNSETHALEWKPVINWYRHARRTDLIEVYHEFGSFICTPNHNIWTPDGYIKAGLLKPGESLLTVRHGVYSENHWPEGEENPVLQPRLLCGGNDGQPGMPGVPSDVFVSDARTGERREAAVLFDTVPGEGQSQEPGVHGVVAGENAGGLGRFSTQGALVSENLRPHVGSQSDAPTGSAQEGQSCFTGHPAQAEGGGGQRATIAGTAEEAGGQDRNGHGVRGADSLGQGGATVRTESLQAGLGGPGAETSGGIGWQQPSWDGRTSQGREEGQGFVHARVERIEVLKPDSDGGYGFGPRCHRHVYDIEVADNHNYFANGTLVSNSHEFRKLDYSTKMNIKGISPEGSVMALKLFVKTRWLEKQRPGRSFAFASGTPITNTLAELFTIQRFFQERQLRALGLIHFDAWAANFARVKTEYERNATGAWEAVDRLSKFVNVADLMAMVKQQMDVLTSSELAHLVKLPSVIQGNAGKRDILVTPRVPELDEYMSGELARRLKASREWKPSKDEPNNPDPVVAIITDGRVSALDMRYIDPRLPNNPDSKLNRLADVIIQQYRETADLTYIDPETKKVEPVKGGTQIVFASLGFGPGIAQSRGFDGRAWLNKRLRAAGIPASEVAWIWDYPTAAAKQAMFKEMRQGKKRILIGSPKNMGTGVNVQKRLTHKIDVDAPWYPSDMEQPDGRILRQGNQNEWVKLVGLATDGTYDSTMYSMVARKSGFIEQAFRGDRSLRVMDDISESSQYAMAAAIASGDPRYVQMAELESAVAKLEGAKELHERRQASLRADIGRFKGNAPILQKAVESARKVQEALEGVIFYSGYFDAVVAGQSMPKVKTTDLGAAVVAVVDREYEKAMGIVQRKALEDNRLGSSEHGGPTHTHKFQAVIGTLAGKAELVLSGKVGAYRPKNKAGQLEKSVSFTYESGAEVHVRVAGTVDPRAVDHWQANPPANRAMAAGGAITDRLNDLQKRALARRREALDENQEALEKAERAYGAPFPEQAKLVQAVTELAQLRRELAGEGKEVPEAAVKASVLPDFRLVRAAPKGGDRQAAYLAEAYGWPGAEVGLGRAVGNSLAESLVVGHAARVKGDIAPNRIVDAIRFSQPKTLGQGYTPDGVRAAIDASEGTGFAAALERTGWFHIITGDQVPEDVRAQAGGDRVPAYTWKGEVYFVADEIHAGDSIPGLLRHEVAVHAMRLNKSDAEFRAILQAMRRLPGDKAAKARAAVPKQTPGHLRDEEALAYFIEQNPTHSLTRRFLAWLRGAIRALARRLPGVERGRWLTWAHDLSEDELIAMANSALRSAVRGDGALTGEDLAKFHRAWHGSPHHHDQFSTGKIGTGEGAQAFGWGLYFTNTKDIAEYYRDTLTPKNRLAYYYNGKIITGHDERIAVDIADGLVRFFNSKKTKEYKDWATREINARWPYDRAAVRRLVNKYEGKIERKDDKGALYEVELAPTEDEYLDWHKPLSEQSETVQAALTQSEYKARHEVVRILDNSPDGFKSKSLTGALLYLRLADRFHSQQSASEYLHSLGIRGIRYPAEGQTGGKAGDRYNYVIFSDEDVSIVAKFSRRPSEPKAPQQRIYSAADPVGVAEKELQQIDAAVAGAGGWGAALKRLDGRGEDSFRKLGAKARREILGALTVHQLVDVGGSVLPRMREYLTEMSAMDATRNRLIHESDALAKRWGGLPKKEIARVGYVMHESTIAGVDGSDEEYQPSIDIKEAKQKIKTLQARQFGAGGDKQIAQWQAEVNELKARIQFELNRRKEWHRVKGLYEALSTEGQAVYRAVRDYHSDHLNRVQDALVQMIEKTRMTGKQKYTAIQQLKEEFELLRVQAPYFPLGRFGDYWVHVAEETDPRTGNVTQERIFEKFETREEADAFYQEQVAAGRQVARGKQLENLREVTGVSATFVAQVEDLIGELGAENPEVADLRDQVYQLYLKTLPEVSSRKHAIHRGKVAGYAKDALRVFANKAFHDAYQYARIKHGFELREIMEQLQADVAAAGSAAKVAEMAARRALLEGFRDEVLAKKMTFRATKERAVVLDAQAAEIMASAKKRRLTEGEQFVIDEAARWNQYAAWFGEWHKKRKPKAMEIKRMTEAQLERELSALDLREQTIAAIQAHPTGHEFAPDLLNELQKAYQWLMNPTTGRVASMLNALGFGFHLAVSPAAWVTNATQTPLIAMPYVAATRGLVKTHKAFQAALGEAMRSSWRWNPHKEHRFGIREALIKQDEIDAYNQALDRGLVDRGRVMDLIGLAEEGADRLGGWQKFGTLMALGFHEAERVNREVTFMAAYRLARDARESFMDAVDYADKVVNETHFNYTAENRARWMRSDAARVLLQFKSYAQHVTYLQWKMVRAALGRAPTPEAKAAARKFLMVQTAVQLAAGGVMGLPLGVWATMGAVAPGLAAAKRWGYKGALLYTFALMGVAVGLGGDDPDDPVDWWAEFEQAMADAFGATGGQAVGRGLVNAVGGIDLSARVSMRELWWREIGKDIEERSFVSDVLTQAAGPSIGVLVDIGEGVTLAAQGQTYRGIERMTPKMIRDGMQAVRFFDEGALTLKGDPLIEELTPLEILARASGFTPSRLTARYAENQAEKQRESRIEARRQRVQQDIAEAGLARRKAEAAGEEEQAAEAEDRLTAALERAKRYNQKQPQYPITPDSLSRSVKGRLRARMLAKDGVFMNRRIPERYEFAPKE